MKKSIDYGQVITANTLFQPYFNVPEYSDSNADKDPDSTARDDESFPVEGVERGCHRVSRGDNDPPTTGFAPPNDLPRQSSTRPDGLSRFFLITVF